jgi:long-chain-fatty-acid--CoA ligase ACSBG
LAANFRGIFTGIYTSNSIDACHHILRTSNAQIIVVDDGNQMKKICAAKQGLSVKAVIQIDGPFDDEVMKHDGFYRWSDLEEMNTDDVEEEYQRRQLEITPNECCAILYTSGTVGNPKGAMISNDNFTWTVKAEAKRLEVSTESQEVLMSYLPLSHMAGQIIDVFLSLYVAATVFFAEKNAIKSSFLDTLLECRPTLFIGEINS